MTRRFRTCAVAAVAAALYGLVGCSTRSQAPATPGLTTATLKVQGLFCPLCVPKIEAALSRVKGYRHLDARVSAKEVTVTYDPVGTRARDLAAAINRLPEYHASVMAAQ
jgi:copper chaperone CopZ